MKFRYFFILILIIAVLLQANRVIEKSSYLSLKQNISFEKEPAKNSTLDIENESKYLIFYNPKSESSKKALYNLEKIFEFTKNEFSVVKITDVPDISTYKYFIFATDDFIGFRKKVFEEIKNKVSTQGGTLFVFSGIKDNPFNKIAGIKKVKKFLNRETEIKFEQKVFPGVDDWSPSKVAMESDGIDVELAEDTNIIAYIGKKNPFIWERIYGNGRVIYGNTNIFEDKILRGVMNQIISYGSDWYINPILKGKLVHLDDFPSPIPRFESEVIRKAYNMDTGDFYNKIWWQDMLGLAARHKLVYTGFIIIDYNNIIELKNMGELPTITLQDLEKRGRELFIHGGELGVHGFNHNPLVFDGDIDFEALEYVPWKSDEDIKGGMERLRNLVKELFGRKVNLYSYVAPSNILKSRGKKALVQGIPTLKTISGLFYGEERGSYITEIGRDSEIDTIYNFPRFSSGFAYDIDEIWATFNAVALYGYMSHFVHPDDIISSDDRYFGKDWEGSFKDFEKTIIESEKRYPYLDGITASELTKRYMNIEDLKISSQRDKNKIKIAIDNFRSPFSAWMRIRGEEIKSISSGNYRLLNKYNNNNFYLIEFQSPDTIIELKERVEKDEEKGD